MQQTAETTRLLRAIGTRVPMDAAALLAQQPPEQVAAVLALLPAEQARRIQRHLRPGATDAAAAPDDAPVPGTVSELMEPATGVLSADDTVEQALAYLRGHPDPQQVTYLFLNGAAGELIGMVVIRDLILAAPTQSLREIMLAAPFSFRQDEPTPEAIRKAVRRHYPVYPVLDGAGRIIGVVRGWRLFERHAVEITAQSGQMVGVAKEERVSTSLWASFKMRNPWLVVNLFTAFLAGAVVALFDDTIAKIVALAAFLPVLAGQTSNTGCQALAITLRGMTLGDLDKYPVARLVKKELLLGTMNGVVTGVVAGAAMWFTATSTGTPNAPMLALVIFLAMTGGCAMSGLFGVLTPLGLKRLGTDPATASSIFLSTGTDIVSMGLMLALATLMVL